MVTPEPVPGTHRLIVCALSGPGLCGNPHTYPRARYEVPGPNPVVGVRRGDSGALGPRLCKILDATFRELYTSTSLVNKEQHAVLISRSDHQDGAVGVPDDRVGDATHKRTLYAA